MLGRLSRTELWEWIAYFKIKHDEARSAAGPGDVPDKVAAAIAAQRALKVDPLPDDD